MRRGDLEAWCVALLDLLVDWFGLVLWPAIGRGLCRLRMHRWRTYAAWYGPDASNNWQSCTRCGKPRALWAAKK